jgi:hypothetical protein
MTRGFATRIRFHAHIPRETLMVRAPAALLSLVSWIPLATTAIASPPTAGVEPIATPCAQHGALEIRGVKLSAASAPRFSRLEMTVDLSATYANPFDSDDVALDTHVTGPNGRLYSFWVSPDASGASYGYVAAGGPGFTGPTDTVGEK